MHLLQETSREGEAWWEETSESTGPEVSCPEWVQTTNCVNGHTPGRDWNLGPGNLTQHAPLATCYLDFNFPAEPVSPTKRIQL